MDSLLLLCLILLLLRLSVLLSMIVNIRLCEVIALFEQFHQILATTVVVSNSLPLNMI